ncbi:MAG: flagellar basal body rod protein FlgC [Deltaproteobacteria bacterium]|nr:flagellar basal body rod protein FlgC [Deltaproteobacteria bacterium]
MDFFSSMRISATGMNAQQTRMNTISSNLANSETTESEEGGPYKRRDPIFTAMPDREQFGEILAGQMDEHAQGVQVTEIQEDQKAPRMVYNPKHPHANAQGYVAMPNVNPVEEMANMISASRSYEANVTALNAAKSMAMRALDIGK